MRERDELVFPGLIRQNVVSQTGQEKQSKVMNAEDPLALLDKAVKGNENTDAEFESVDTGNPHYVHPAYSDERYLPSPFAEILRRAFAPNLDTREMLIANLGEEEATVERIDQAFETWEEKVVDPFRKRYGFV